MFLEKKPLPIQQLLPSPHLPPPVAPSSAGGPLALRSVLEVSGVNETAELFWDGKPVSLVLRAASGAIFILEGHLSGNKQPLQTVLFTTGQQISDEIRPIQQRFLAHTLLAAGFFNLRILVLTRSSLHTPCSAPGAPSHSCSCQGGKVAQLFSG